MSTVAQILKSKPVNQPVRTLPPQATVREAIELMAEHRIGALLVAEGDRIVGIFTERDYARKIEVRGRASGDTRLAEVMTPDVLHVGPATTTQECMALMTDKRLRHLPVLDGDRLVGIVSIGDLVKYRIDRIEAEAAAMRDYIQSA